MQAMIYRGPWKMPLEALEEPRPAKGQVVVEVQAAGICGSDVHGFTGKSGRRTPGIVMGHEFAGTIGDVGAETGEYQVGDEVVVMPLFSVAEGADPYPINMSPHRRLTGMNEHGAYAQRVAVRASQLFRKPEALNWQRAALCEPLAVTLHAARITSGQPDGQGSGHRRRPDRPAGNALRPPEGGGNDNCHRPLRAPAGAGRGVGRRRCHQRRTRRHACRRCGGHPRDDGGAA